MPNWLPWRERVRSPWSASLFPSVVLLIAALIVFVAEQGWSLRTERQLVLRTLRPGLSAVHVVENLDEWIQARWQLQRQLAEKVIQLESDLATQSVEYAELTRLRNENAELRQMQLSPSSRRLPSEWWGVPRSWWVNQGCHDGVRVGNPVVADGVFVGEVTQVLPQVSAVRTLDSLDWQFPVRVGTQSAVGIFSTARGMTEVREVSQTVAIQAGDVVFTPGSPTQPAYLPLARVTEVQPEVGFGTWRIVAEPLRVPTQLRFVEVMVDPVEGEEGSCLTP